MSFLMRAAIALVFFSSLSAHAQTCRDLFALQQASRLSANYYTAETNQPDSVLNILDQVAQDPKQLQTIKRFAVIDSNKVNRQAERSRAILDTTLNALKSRKPNQTIVVYNGSMHSKWLFETLGPRADVAYITPVVSTEGVPILELLRDTFPKTDLLEPKERDLFVEMFRVSLALRRIDGQRASGMHSFSIDTVEQILNSPHRESDDLPQNLKLVLASQFFRRYALAKTSPLSAVPPLAHPPVYVINDYHQLNSPSFLAELPTTQQLKEQNIQEVVIYLESFASDRSRPLRFDDVKKTATMNVVQDYLLYVQKVQGKATASKIASAFVSGPPALVEFGKAFNKEVVVNPILNSLLELVQERYISQGIKVTFKGLEPKIGSEDD